VIESYSEWSVQVEKMLLEGDGFEAKLLLRLHG
jgi:hypothetical protein